MAKITIGLIGSGRIALSQHIPVLAASPRFNLIAIATRNGAEAGVPNIGIDCYDTIEDMLSDHPDLDAVAVATPTPNHFASAYAALRAGKHVLIEKPPCATNAEFDRLIALSAHVKRSLYQTWHLRHAPRVAEACAWLKNRAIVGGRVEWRENVEDCHPGQTWIWQPGGFGVFDPGINAISVLVSILPETIFVEKAELFTPPDCAAPIAADIVFRCESGARIEAAFDFSYRGKPAWHIGIDTDKGRIALADAATTLSIGDQGPAQPPPRAAGPRDEYEAIYRHFADLIDTARSDVDARPLRLVSDAFLLARHKTLTAHGSLSG